MTSPPPRLQTQSRVSFWAFISHISHWFSLNWAESLPNSCIHQLHPIPDHQASPVPTYTTTSSGSDYWTLFASVVRPSHLNSFRPSRPEPSIWVRFLRRDAPSHARACIAVLPHRRVGLDSADAFLAPSGTSARAFTASCYFDFALRPSLAFCSSQRWLGATRPFDWCLLPHFCHESLPLWGRTGPRGSDASGKVLPSIFVDPNTNHMAFL